MNTRQKMTSLPRWLVNIGLTLQFYIPCPIYLFLACAAGYTFLNPSPHPQSVAPDKSGGLAEGLGLIIDISMKGFLVFAGMLLLIVLFVNITWCLIYQLWDRYDQHKALGFLIVTNFIGGGIWLCLWVGSLSSSQQGVTLLFSPAPIVIPTLLYIIALVLLMMREKKESHSISQKDEDSTS